MTDPLQSIGDYVQETMASWQIPGVALAVIRGGEVLHSAGYGVRNVETGQPITPDTRFAIASCTKAFTAMGVALLVDEGKVEWDKPVREYLPTFKLRNEYAAEHISLRDMLCHRSGLPRHDLAWYNTAFTREELVKNLAYHEPNKDFRAGWEYQNLMFVTAGYVTGMVAGTTWEDYIQTHIFDRLGMSSSFSAATMRQSDNYSLPYRIRRGKQPGEVDTLELMPFYDNPVMGPAGAIHASLSDLTKWLSVHLNDGKAGDVQLVSPGNLAPMHQPTMIRPPDAVRAQLMNTTLAAYGLGWFIEPYRGGYTLIHHGGNIDGFSLLVSFIPQAKIGVIVLTNIDGRPLRDYLPYEVYDRLLGLPDNEWDKKFHAIYSEMFKAQDQGRDVSGTERIASAPPSHPLADYVGEYAADGYADFNVKLDNDALFGWLAGQWWSLAHYHYDTFELDLDRFDEHLKMTFVTGTRGSIDAVRIPIEPTVPDVPYKRKPAKVDSATLAQLTGDYALPIEGLTLTVTLKPDGRLFAHLTGQKEAELALNKITEGSLEFAMKGVPNVSLEFTGSDGTYAMAVLKQFGAVFKAPRVG